MEELEKEFQEEERELKKRLEDIHSREYTERLAEDMVYLQDVLKYTRRLKEESSSLVSIYKDLLKYIDETKTYYFGEENQDIVFETLKEVQDILYSHNIKDLIE